MMASQFGYNPPWARGDWTVRNPQSSAAGDQPDEFQMLQMKLMRQALAAGEGGATPTATPVASTIGKGLFKFGSGLAAKLGASGGGALATAAGAAAVAAPIVGIGLLANSAMMKAKRKAQRERRNIKIQAGIERGRETQAITEAALGTARRLGSDVAAVSAANGMGGSGPALNAVLQNRAQILSGIPDQVRADRQAITQQEQQRLDETSDGTEIPAFLLRTLLPQGGDFLRGAFSK